MTAMFPRLRLIPQRTSLRARLTGRQPGPTMSELYHECGVAAIYHLPGAEVSPHCTEHGPEEVSRLIPRMLRDIQNRGQLSAGFTTYNGQRKQLIDTHKDVGSVNEVFRLAHRRQSEGLMREYAGPAAIGHVRYATCGEDDRSYAQPFERHHLQKHKWFSFGFNGQLANYQELRQQLLAGDGYHLARGTDTQSHLAGVLHAFDVRRRLERVPDPLRFVGLPVEMV